MLYVERDASGNIISLHKKPEAGADEQKSLLDEEIREFINSNVDTDPGTKQLSYSDIGIIRILEDLIGLLINKNIILFTELPEEAQAKIRDRKRLREKNSPEHLMADDII